MGARQDADFRHDGTHGLGVAAVDAQAGVQDGVADDVGFQFLQQRLGLVFPVLGQVGFLAAQGFNGLLLGGADTLVAGLLEGFLVRLGDAGAGQAVQAGFQGGGLGRRLGSVHGSFAACSARSMIAWITGWKCWWP